LKKTDAEPSKVEPSRTGGAVAGRRDEASRSARREPSRAAVRSAEAGGQRTAIAPSPAPPAPSESVLSSLLAGCRLGHAALKRCPKLETRLHYSPSQCSDVVKFEE